MNTPQIPTYAGLPSKTATVLACAFVFAFFSYSWWWSSAPVAASDTAGYISAAQDLADFQIDHLLARTPGYPLLLLLTGSVDSPTRRLFFVSMLLHFACVWTLADVLYRVGLREWMLISFGLLLLLPPFVEPAAYALSENLAQAMLVASFISLVFWFRHNKAIWILISAVTIGYAGLTRPTYQMLAFAMAGYLVIARYLFQRKLAKWNKVLGASLILICGSMVMVGGYAFLNFTKFGYFGVTPHLGFALSQKTLRFIERLPDEYAPIRETLIRARNAELIGGSSHTRTEYIYAAGTKPELSRITGLPYAKLSQYMLRINLLLIQKAPLLYLEDVVWAFGSYWFPPSRELANSNSRIVQALWTVLHFCLIGGFAVNLILLIGAAAYIKVGSRALSNGLPRREIESIQLQGLLYGLAGTVVFYSAAISSLVVAGEARYRVPTDVLIVFMLFLGTHLWWRLVDLSRATDCGGPGDVGESVSSN